MSKKKAANIRLELTQDGIADLKYENILTKSFRTNKIWKYPDPEIFGLTKSKNILTKKFRLNKVWKYPNQ